MPSIEFRFPIDIVFVLLHCVCVCACVHVVVGRKGVRYAAGLLPGSVSVRPGAQNAEISECSRSRFWSVSERINYAEITFSIFGT